MCLIDNLLHYTTSPLYANAEYTHHAYSTSMRIACTYMNITRTYMQTPIHIQFNSDNHTHAYMRVICVLLLVHAHEYHMHIMCTTLSQTHIQ